MRLIWHQLGKDVRQFRAYLALWFGLLLINLAVNCDWIGKVYYTPHREFNQASNIWTSILPVVLWGLIGLLPTLVVLADSPARRDGFLSTRPMPRWTLFVAKVFFVLGLILVPWTLQELIHLASSGMPGWVARQGALERILLSLPIAFALAAFAALWPDMARWARAVGILFGCFIVLEVSLAAYLYASHGSGDMRHPANPLLNLYALMFAVMILALWHARSHWKPWARWTGFFLAVILSQAGLSYSSNPPSYFRPLNQARADSSLRQIGLEVRPHDFHLRTLWNQVIGKKLIQAYVAPTVAEAPTGEVVEWATKSSTIRRPDGQVIPHAAAIGTTPLFTSDYWRNYRESEYRSMAGQFPEGVLFYKENFYDQWQSIGLGEFKQPDDHAEFSESLQMGAEIEARLFQWEKIADLSLQPGSSASDDFGSWKVLHTTTSDGDIYLERTQVQLMMESDPRGSSAYSGPLSRMVWFLYRPSENVAWLSDPGNNGGTDRADETALVRDYLVLRFNVENVPVKIDPAQDRLVIMEKTWVGSTMEKWNSGPFTLNDKLEPPYHSSLQNNQQMSEDDFKSRLAAIHPPAPDASTRDVTTYLLQFLQLVEAYRIPLGTDDAATKQLAQLVPSHLDLLIDSLPALDVARITVASAITDGATDAQKSVIIAALPRNPQLASVVLARNWEGDARPELFELLKSREELPEEAFAAIVSFHDPATYPGLLEQFERNPDENEADRLRPLPGMESKVKDIIERRWRKDSLIITGAPWQMFTESFILAMRSGDTNALNRLYQVLDEPSLDRSASAQFIGGALTQSMRTPEFKKGGRGNMKEVMAWVKKHRPEDFVFDATERKFVLKQSP